MMQMPNTQPDFRALCANLLAEIDARAWGITSLPSSEAIDRARAALAAEQQGPTDDELDELWGEIEGGGAIWSWQPYAREVLARWGR